MQVKDMLNKAKTVVSVTPIETREVMLGCFVTIHEETERQARTSLCNVV